MNTIFSSAGNLIIFILMLGLLVFVHELGHFAVAKRLKIPVPEFGFGFPPRVLKFWQGAGWIEIQGKHIIIPRKFPLPQNLNVGSNVVYKTEMQKGREVLTGIDVIDDESKGLLLTSPVQNLDRGTEYTLNAIPLGGFVRLMGEEDPNVPGGFATAKPSVRIPILVAGVTMNFILAFLIFCLTAVLTPPYVTMQTTSIAGVQPGSPAAAVDLRVNDVIASVNGQDVKNNYPLLSQLLRKNAGQAVSLDVIRNGKTLDPVTVTPRANPPRGEGPLGIALNGWVGLRISTVEPGSVADKAGARPGDVLVFLVDPKGRTLRDQNEFIQYTTAHPGWKIEWRLARNNQLLDPITVQIPEKVDASNATLGLQMQTSLLDAPKTALDDMWTVIASVPPMIGQVFSGNAPANAFVGPLGIYQVTGEVAQRGGAIALLQLLGLLSLNLAVVNLLPLPALDGGRLVFVVLEWIRGGKRIDPQKEGMVHLIGLAVLVGLMILISVFDVQRLISGQSILPGP
ncbi:MAG: RIP metalloprotease RseP [Chloroflexi bacterium]|nr:RIP metalloprotease RseP [Chloroflexota bacterium]